MSSPVEVLWNKADRIELSNGPSRDTYKVFFKNNQEVIGQLIVPVRSIASLKAKNFKRIYFAAGAELEASTYAPRYEEFKEATASAKSFSEATFIIGSFVIVSPPTSSTTATSPASSQPPASQYKKLLSKGEAATYFDKKVEINRQCPIVYKKLKEPSS